MSHTPDPLKEQLSALLDGELDAERALFLRRRLQHDVALQAQLERWQWMGETLRAQARGASDFSAAVMARLAVEEALPADEVPPASATAPRYWPWFAGGTLAASLALFLLHGRPLQPDAPVAVPVLAEVPASVPAEPEAPRQIPAPAPEPVPEVVTEAVAEAAPAPARPVLAATAEPAGATPVRRAGNRLRRPPAEVAVTATLAATPATEAPHAAQPFAPPEAPPAWPRAAVPMRGQSAFTVRHDTAQPFSLPAADNTH